MKPTKRKKSPHVLDLSSMQTWGETIQAHRPPRRVSNRRVTDLAPVKPRSMAFYETMPLTLTSAFLEEEPTVSGNASASAVLDKIRGIELQDNLKKIIIISLIGLLTLGILIGSIQLYRDSRKQGAQPQESRDSGSGAIALELGSTFYGSILLSAKPAKNIRDELEQFMPLDTNETKTRTSGGLSKPNSSSNQSPGAPAVDSISGTTSTSLPYEKGVTRTLDQTEASPSPTISSPTQPNTSTNSLNNDPITESTESTVGKTENHSSQIIPNDTLNDSTQVEESVQTLKNTTNDLLTP